MRPSSTPEVWARCILAVWGVMAAGKLGYLHPLLGPLVALVWAHYALTTPPRRVAALLGLGLGIGLVLRTVCGL